MLDDAQRAILAVGGVLNEINKDDHARLGGAPRASGAGRAMYILANGWSIFTPADALSSLEWLAKKGHRFAYAERDGSSPEAFHGWDFGRMANVAGWSYVAYLIDRETAWAWMKRAATGVRSAFSSYAELGRSYLRGQKVWADGREDARLLSTQQAVGALVSREGSPFLLPFLPSIDDVPMPPDDVREVHVEAGASIASAVEAAGPSGRVILGAGTFRESVRPAHPVEIVGAGREATVLQGVDKPALYVDARIGVLARGLVIRAGKTAAGATLSAVLVSEGFAHLEDVMMMATHHGVALRKDGDAHVFGSRIVGCGKSGIDADGGNLVVLDTEVTNAGLHGIARLGGKLASVLQRARVEGAAEGGIVANGEITIRDTTVTAPGKFGILADGAATIERTTITDSRGWGLLVDGEHAHVHVESATVEGSKGANVDVKRGYVEITRSEIRRGASSGVILQGAARVLFAGSTIEDNAQGNVYAMDGAQHVIGSCTLRGGSLGFWSRGSVGFVEDSTLEGAAGAGVQVLGAGGPSFLNCEIRACGVGVEVSGEAAPLFSACNVIGSRGPGWKLADGTRAMLEDCGSNDNAAPDSTGPARVATLESIDPNALAAPVEDGEGITFPLDVEAFRAIFAFRADRDAQGPLAMLIPALARAILASVGPEPVTLVVQPESLLARASDPAVRARVREAVAHVLREPQRLAAQLDQSAVFGRLEAMRAHG